MKFHELLPSMTITILLLLLLEIVVSTFFPLIGLSGYRLHFNILIVLYLGFKLDSPFLGPMILIIQYCHSFFSIEGWAIGTTTGIMVCIAISYLKEILNFNSIPITMVVTQLFQLLWLGFVSLFLYMKSVESAYLMSKLMRFLPESIVISMISPFFFKLLDRFWKFKEGESLAEGH
jgi:hypothetical protein